MSDRDTVLPRDTWPQHYYPRLRGYSVGEDGEVTSHLCLGLPCCGLDLLIEHPSTLTAVELYQIAGMFARMNQQVSQLPSFQVCTLPEKTVISELSVVEQQDNGKPSQNVGSPEDIAG